MGMTPMRAIAAATRVNAQIIGKGRELGSIEPGKIADVIVVNGNPLFDIVALAQVEVAVKDGVVYKGAPSPRENQCQTRNSVCDGGELRASLCESHQRTEHTQSSEDDDRGNDVEDGPVTHHGRDGNQARAIDDRVRRR